MKVNSGYEEKLEVAYVRVLLPETGLTQIFSELCLKISIWRWRLSAFFDA